MPSKDIHRETRLRMAANLRLLKWRLEIDSDAEFGRRIGLSRGVVNRAMKGDRTFGLDFLLSVKRKLGIHLDWFDAHEPPEEWYDPDFKPPHPPGVR